MFKPTMKNFYELTLQEVIDLKPAEIEKYAAEVGKKYVEKHRAEMEKKAGVEVIRRRIKALKKMQSEI